MNDKADSERSIFHDGGKVPHPRPSLPPHPSITINGPSPDDTADYYNGLCLRGLGTVAATLTAAWLQAQIAAVASSSQLAPLLNDEPHETTEDDIKEFILKNYQRWTGKVHL